MPSATRLYRFPTQGALRLAKAALRGEPSAGVQRIITLAPILEQSNPDGLPTVETVMRNLIGDGPTGGLEADRAREPAAHAPRRKPRPIAAKATLGPAFERVGMTVAELQQRLFAFDDQHHVASELVRRFGHTKHG